MRNTFKKTLAAIAAAGAVALAGCAPTYKAELTTNTYSGTTSDQNEVTIKKTEARLNEVYSSSGRSWGETWLTCNVRTPEADHVYGVDADCDGTWERIDVFKGYGASTHMLEPRYAIEAKEMLNTAVKEIGRDEFLKSSSKKVENNRRIYERDKPFRRE